MCNTITDVQGVQVGHVTLFEKDTVRTGVTAILPHSGNLFYEKVFASSYVINGFGKTVGTIQLQELGVIESPILLTNTLSVAATLLIILIFIISLIIIKLSLLLKLYFF
ncbi:P1 family peptidase [Bacillus cereus]|uniref:P1 family peptidase n=1 Tax=Bacillus cereus TaxID=1396 RepID=UPI0039818C84